MSKGERLEHRRAIGMTRAESSARYSVSTERLRAAFDGMAVGMILKGAEGETLESNPALRRMLGYGEEELRGMVRSDYTLPEDAGRDAELYRQLLAGERDSFRMEKRYVRKDGSVMWGRLSVSRIEGAEGEPAFAVGVVEDITENREAAQEIERLNRQNRLILDSAGEGIYGLDTEGKTTFVNPAATAMTGFDPEDMIGKSQHEVVHHSRSDGTSYSREECPIYAALTDGEIYHVDDEVFWRKDGTQFPVEYTSTPIREDGEVTGAVVTFTDVTERKALEERLEYQAFHDGLTDLPNRQLFVDRLGQALRRTSRQRSRVAVLFVDLDGFKVVNDSLGHEAGDKLLVAVAERLKGCLRPEDTLARFGGDEFTVLLEEVEGPDDALRVTRRITEEFRGPFVLDRREMSVRLSIGVALGDAHTESSEELLRNADAAMYQAKDEAAWGYRMFDPAMHERVLGRMGLENDLRLALEREEFRLFYQPKVRLKEEDTIAEVEALVRWEHPQRGLLMPDEFIPLAEETGLIVPIGRWVLKETCRQVKGWQERYPKTPPLVACVNVSAGQLRYPDLLHDVGTALRESGIEARSLALEITESALVKDMETSMTVLKELREEGIRFALDDFGSEYSSLSYLMRLPVDFVKIDKSFVWALGEDPRAEVIVEAIISLAHSLGLEAVGEGVENAEQLEDLRRMGCDLVQGYHLAKPLPPEDVPEFLAE